MIERLLAVLTRHGPLVLAIGLALGVVVPALATTLRPALGPLVALLMLVSVLRLEPEPPCLRPQDRVARENRNPFVHPPDPPERYPSPPRGGVGSVGPLESILKIG